jgi:hypothetical protein
VLQACRSDEAMAGTDVGTQGWNPFTQINFSSYTIVPEPSIAALADFGMAAMLMLRRRK